MRQLLLGVAVLAGLGGATRADETILPRYLEFRDGSVLRLPVVDEVWKVTLVRPDGTIENASVRLSALERLVLLPEPVLEKKRALLEVVKRLGADRFAEREQAQDKLVKMGPAIRPDLESFLEVFTDLEVRARLEQIIQKLPPPAPDQPIKVADTFDQFAGKEVLRGDAGPGDLAVKIDGQTRRFGRKDVRAMTTKAPESNDPLSLRGGPGGFRRIDDKDFPRGCVEESFDTDPTGRKLTPGENVEKLFVGKGFTLSTSIGTSFVSVNDYVVQGKSKGQSAATHQPLFQGEVTIRFCRPGNEKIPAGVTHFGLWIAHVAPQGTMMVAYDLQGRELGSIQTTRDGSEFLAVQSAVPIHRIKIVPNLQIDPDFTLDDFIFRMPRTGDTAHAEKFLAEFADGERVFCADVSLTARGEVRLHGLPAGLPERTRPAAELVRVATPDKKLHERPPQAGVFAELRDGSVIFGSATARVAPTFLRRLGVLKEKDSVVGVWSTEQSRMAWPAKAQLPAIWDTEKRTWQTVAEVAFTEEAVAWTADGKRRARAYSEVAPLLLRLPAGEPEVGSWRVRTVQGEEIVLGTAAAPPITGTLSRGLEARWGEVTLKVPAAELVSVFRVVKE